MCVGIETGELYRKSEFEMWRLEGLREAESQNAHDAKTRDVATNPEYDIGFPDGVGYGSDGQIACEKKRAPHDKVRCFCAWLWLAGDCRVFC